MSEMCTRAIRYDCYVTTGYRKWTGVTGYDIWDENLYGLLGSTGILRDFRGMTGMAVQDIYDAFTYQCDLPCSSLARSVFRSVKLNMSSSMLSGVLRARSADCPERPGR